MDINEIQVGRFGLNPFRQLSLLGNAVPLGRKALDILSVLAAANGAVVTKGDLMDAIWPNLTIEENAIQVHIAALRKALGSDAILVKTVHGIGYRLVVDCHQAYPGKSNIPSRSSVAVLPFVNMTGDAELEHVGDGMAEELISTLSQNPKLKVSSRTSSFAFRERHLDARQIADDLGVATLVEGSVRVAGNRVRVTAQLIDAVDGNHIWSKNFEHEMVDLLVVESDITACIAKELAGFLNSALCPS